MQLLFSKKNKKIANKSTTTEVKAKISRLRMPRIL
jgi:hypothetical protein